MLHNFLTMIFKIYFQYFYLFISILLFSPLLSQNIKINGISAIVGNEIILESDINELLVNPYKEDKDLKQQKCKILKQLLFNKILIFYAKKDQSINIEKNEINYYTNKYINLYLKKIGSTKELLQIFNCSSMNELYSEFFQKIENQYYIEQKQKSIINHIDIGPNEVKKFFQKYKSNLSVLNDEFCLAHIVLYPKISNKSKNKIISKLKLIKKEIENGNSTFSEQAKMYSDDKKSALEGGLYTNIKRGDMPNEFDAIVFNLKENNISDPFYTKFGFHIVKLEKKRGQFIDFRHIFLKAIPNQEEITIAQNQLDSIKKIIENHKISFQEAAFKFSNDNLTYLNGGILLDNNLSKECRIEKSKLSTKEIFYISSLKNGEISDVFEDEINEQKVVRILQLIKFYPEHELNLNQDYTKIKNIAILKKTQNKLKNWIIHQIPNTFIKINKKYQNCNFNINS